MSDSRLRRLNALVNAKQGPASTTTSKQKREKIKAKVLFCSNPEPVIQEQNEKDKAELSNQLQTLDLQQAQSTAEILFNEREAENKAKSERREENEEDEKDEYEEEEELASTGPLLRPMFVPKQQRSEQQAVKIASNKDEKSLEAHELLVEYVKKEYQASSATKADQDKDISNFDPSMVDDTDEVDEDKELEAWKLRELLRIKRDKTERERWERDKIELERIRNMTEEERRKLDEEKVKEWMEKPQGQMRFMQKYYHKGAFFMDKDEQIYQRDYAQPTGEDANANREVLPEVKQVRDFGKKGRSKWTHLVGEDTTAFDYGWGQRKNEMNYKLVSKMGGMRGHLDNPSAPKKPKQ